LSIDDIVVGFAGSTTCRGSRADWCFGILANFLMLLVLIMIVIVVVSLVIDPIAYTLTRGSAVHEPLLVMGSSTRE
jgi:hypothetical protein